MYYNYLQMSTLLIGNKGQLGTCIENIVKKKSLGELFFVDLPDFDITDENCVKSCFFDIKPDVIINCAAYTNVDKAEEEEEQAELVNTFGMKLIGYYSSQINAKVIHISTDYVYDGYSYKPINENDPVNPLSVYGTTKLDGELMLFAENLNSLIIRTAWLYSNYGKNFVKTMLNVGKQKEEIRVVYDQIGTPTYAPDLAEVIINIVENTLKDKSFFVPGFYHYSNEGVCSWYDFAVLIFKLAKINCKVIPILSDEYPTPAHRPKYAILDKGLIKKQFGITIPHWSSSLEKFFKHENI